MAENKKGFIFYTDWIEVFRSLPKGKGYDLLIHLLAYVNDENPKSKDPLINSIFVQMKNTLKRDLKKWEKQQEQRSLAGKKSAEVRKRNATSVNERSISSTVTDTVSVTVIDYDEKEKTPSHNFYTIHEFEKIEFIDNEFTLLCCRYSGKTKEQLKTLFDNFILLQKGVSKITWKDEADAKTHFHNWLKKQPKPQQINSVYKFTKNNPSN